MDLKSGEIIKITGYYSYDGHVDSGDFDCFVPSQSYRMFFKKDQKSPLLGSCEHKIKWKFIEEY